MKPHNGETLTGPEENVITGIVYDSRDVVPGSCFVALQGLHTDGHQYIKTAIKKGALAVVFSTPPESYDEKIAWLQVKDTRKALSRLSVDYYDDPSKEIIVIGVTGTDGKSTTVYFIQQLLEMEGEKAGLLSTVNIKTGDKLETNPFRQSTPEASHIQRILREMVDNGLKYAVIEATSHGLSPKTDRLTAVDFEVAVLTNVTHEHIEFHGTHEQYRMDKSNLFRTVAKKAEKETSFGVINADDDWVEFFLDAAGMSPVFTYSLKDPEADLFVSRFSCDPSGTDFSLVIPGEMKETRINLPGLFNVENVMASLLAVSELLDCSPLDLIDHVPSLKGVKGRMTRIEKKQPFTVIVDYAHTPGSFEKLFPTVKSNLQGHLIVVFGSAGERDTEKRMEQGEIADEYCDFIILTDEDPRGEDRMQILKDIAEGISDKKENQNLFLVPDREEAIRKAISIARDGDMVLTLGKSHETSIIQADGPHHWDEIAVVEKILAEKGY
jgi:UDP-N-acetylmuramoyl-L-alanyl-D-glutamate--2,6-diaminopimelate ligase